jgi:Tol biopolymer transport system component
MYIAMPHYEGETLQGRVARGPVEIGEAVDIVLQLASGLAKAHEQGIVHRDVKPGNIFITKDGHVKILDFGLAKLATETRLTKSGMTLGTIAYMSPEQASGGDVDARSDLFSLGAVFYELLTGALPFKGDHEAAIIYGIMHNDPEPLQAYRSDIPDGLQHVIDMALSKNVDERYQSAQELKTAIAELGQQTGSQAQVSSGSRGVVSRRPFRRLVPWMVVGGTVLTIALFVIRNATSPSMDRPPSVSATYTQLTFSGDTTDPIISPDGQFVAYFREEGNQKQVLVRDIDGGEPVVVFEGFGYCYSLRWSPDGAKLLAVLFTPDAKNHIFIAPRLGGSLRRLDYYPYAAWSPDGLRLAVSWMPWKKIAFIDVSTGKVEPDVLELEFPYVWLHDLDWSPDGSRLLVHVRMEDSAEGIWTVGLDGGNPARVARERQLLSPRWAPSGEAVYYGVPKGATQTLWRVGVDPESGQTAEKPAVIISGMTGLGRLSFTTDGTKMAYARHIVDRDLWLFSTHEGKDGKSTSRRITTGTAVDDWPSVSPDGREVVFVRVTGEASNIFTVPIDGGTATQITFMNSECYNPVWSPDGQRIAFVSYEGGRYQLWKVSRSGGAAEIFENTQCDQDPALIWAPGDDILYRTPEGRDFMILDPDSDDESRLTGNDTLGWMDRAAMSPDKKRVATMWNRPGHGIWIVSLGESLQEPVLEGHNDPFGWSPNGEWIYYYNGPTIGRVRSDGTGDEVVRVFPFENVEEHPQITLSPDAKHVIGGFEVQTPSDIWLIENFDPDN